MPRSAERPPGYYEIMETAVRELLVEKRLIGAGRDPPPDRGAGFAHAGARRQGRSARLGRSRLRRRLLANGRAACEELGISFYDDTQLIVLENTEKVHNLIVCTLCSCYPRPVLGLPPDWYKLKPYRARAVIEPRAVLAEFGTIIPDEVEIRVSDSTAMVRYLVLPKRPGRHRGLQRGAAGRPGHARHDDRRRPGRALASREGPTHERDRETW